MSSGVAWSSLRTGTAVGAVMLAIASHASGAPSTAQEAAEASPLLRSKVASRVACTSGLDARKASLNQSARCNSSSADMPPGRPCAG